MGVKREAPVPTYPEPTDISEFRPPFCEDFYCRYDIWLILICVIAILLVIICWLIFNVRRQVQPAAWFRDMIILTRNPDHPALTNTAVRSLFEDFEDNDHRGVAMKELVDMLLPSDVLQDAKKTLRTSQAGCSVPQGNV